MAAAIGVVENGKAVVAVKIKQPLRMWIQNPMFAEWLRLIRISPCRTFRCGFLENHHSGFLAQITISACM